MAKKSSKKEVAELEKSYESISGKKPKEKSTGKGRIAAIICGIVALVLVIAALVIIFLFPWLVTPGRIHNKLHIAGVDVSGMSELEAVIAVSKATKDSYSTNTMIMNAGDVTVELPPELSAITLDVPAAVEAGCQLTQDQDHLDLTPI